MGYDLVAEPVLSWRDGERRRGYTTLPGLLARLASGDLADFPRVRTHQLHPWCMFLAQLAAIALRRAGQSDPRLSEAEWAELLLDLTGGDHDPWSLVVDDLSKPAFFQPPVPENTLKGWRARDAPDDIDVLVTAKGHDVKSSQMSSEGPEAWVYALTTLQTMQGYPGRGYNRISRMKGAYGSRPRVGRTRNHSIAVRFSRDVEVLLETWPRTIEAYGYREDGLALVWTESWDGRTSVATHQLVPNFIEICSRVRCYEARAGVSCCYTTTQVRRCLPEIDGGDVGDVWSPVERATRGALTVGPRGFNYRLLTRLLFENEFEPSPAQIGRDGDHAPVFLVASVLARGQSRTEGLHERIMLLSHAVRLKLGEPDGRSALGRRASGRVDAASKIRSKVLYPSLKQLAIGGDPLPDDLDSRIDRMFFDHLFATLSLSDDDARAAFDEQLRALAWDELQRAVARACLSDARRFKAISAAERMFAGCLKKNFPDLAAARAAAGVGAS